MALHLQQHPSHPRIANHRAPSPAVQLLYSVTSHTHFFLNGRLEAATIFLPNTPPVVGQLAIDIALVKFSLIGRNMAQFLYQKRQYYQTISRSMGFILHRFDPMFPEKLSRHSTLDFPSRALAESHHRSVCKTTYSSISCALSAGDCAGYRSSKGFKLQEELVNSLS